MNEQANPGPSWAKDHTLTTVVETETVKVYRVGRPGTRINSFEVSFTPEAICISGDIAPGKCHGVVARGRAVSWFVEANDPRYLAEKFLYKGFHTEVSNEWLRDLASEYIDPEHYTTARQDIADRLLELVNTEAAESPEALRSAVEEILPDHDFSEGGPWDYNPIDLEMLANCQRVFARLYLAKAEAEEPIRVVPAPAALPVIARIVLSVTVLLAGSLLSVLGDRLLAAQWYATAIGFKFLSGAGFVLAVVAAVAAWSAGTALRKVPHD